MSERYDLRFETDDTPREECGVFAVARVDGQPDAERDIPLGTQAYQGLLGLQHRGEDGAGISVFDADQGAFVTSKNKGLITDVFAGGRHLSGFPHGSIALAHTRYGTGKKSGDAAERVRQAHPLGGKDSLFMLAMNGHVKELENRRGLTDTEYLVEIIDSRMTETGEDFRTSLLTVLRSLNGGYSIVASDGESLFAARDPWGFRPLFQARSDKYQYFISEDSALGPIRGISQYDAEEVAPGTLWTVPLDGSEGYAEEIYAAQQTATCAMEFAYFARPDTILHGRSVQEIRFAIGEKLARHEEPDFTADVVVGIPDSGLDTAAGYAMATGIPNVRAITKNAYVGRTFILENQDLREATAYLKFHVTRSLVKGKDVVVTDDSVVRGTTGRVYIKKLRDAGAKSIHLRIGFPPHANPCIYGIDTGNPSELLARRKDGDLEEMRKYFGVDSLRFITDEQLREAINSTPSWRDEVSAQLGGLCTACVTGNYPTAGRVVDLPLPKIRTS